MLVHKIDENGYFVEDVILKEGETIPNNYIEIRPPQPCYKPRWDGTEWVEEGEPPKPKPKPIAAEERLEALEQAMLDLILGGAE